jgi:hypothetical protein
VDRLAYHSAVLVTVSLQIETAARFAAWCFQHRVTAAAADLDGLCAASESGQPLKAAAD